MLDLHCHYLPGVDDGARTLDEGIALVRAAAANGIERIVLTPHVHPGRYGNTLNNLKPRFENFRRAVESARIPVQLALGSEARLCDELLPMLDRGEVPLLESAIGAKTLLLELPHSHIPPGCSSFIRWLQRRDIAPLLVHPERNKELMAHPQRLHKLREAGCMVQVTAAAVIGRFGSRAQQAANSFLEKGWVNVVASDAHNLRHRPPLMREAAVAIAERFGEEVAHELMVTAPAALTAGSFKRAKLAAPAANMWDAEPPLLIPLKSTLREEPSEKTARNMPPLLEDEVIAPVIAGKKPLVAQEKKPVSPERNAVLEKLACDTAFSKMRSELLKRANEPTSHGARAARILRLMNALEAR